MIEIEQTVSDKTLNYSNMSTRARSICYFATLALNSLEGRSVYPITKKIHRRGKSGYDLKCGPMMAESEEHVDENYYHPLLLPTSSHRESPDINHLVMGRVRLRPDDGSKREERIFGQLADWFGIDIEAQLFLELLDGRGKFRTTMWETLTLNESLVDEPYCRFFYILRAELLVNGNVQLFVDIAQNPELAQKYGIEDAREIIRDISEWLKAPEMLEMFDSLLGIQTPTLAEAA